MASLQNWISRVLTTVIVLSTCALTASQGWEFARFDITRTWIGPDDNRAEALKPWISVPGVAVTARKSSLTLVTENSDILGALKRQDELTELLSVKPLSPDYWLSLARMWIVTEEKPNKVVAALEFSALTGTNESYLMPQRGILGLTEWEALTPEIRRRSATDITTLALTQRERIRLRSILSAKTTEVRQEIRATLQAAGYSSKDLASLGL
jgi:hypothetical protein